MKQTYFFVAAVIGAFFCPGAVLAEPGKKRIEFWSIPGGATCQRIIDNVLDNYGTRVQIKTFGGVYQQKDSPLED